MIIEKHFSIQNARWVYQIVRRCFFLFIWTSWILELKFVILVKKILLPSWEWPFVYSYLADILFSVLCLFAVIHSFKWYSLENDPSPATVLGFGNIKSLCCLPSWSSESGVEDSTEQIVISVSYSCYKREMNGVEWMHLAREINGVFALLLHLQGKGLH